MRFQISNFGFQICALLLCSSMAQAQTLEERFESALQESLNHNQGVDTPRSPACDDPEVNLPELLPIPDPISSPPSIEYAAASEAYYVKFFTAPWCGPCRTFKKADLPELEAEYPVTIIDVVEHPDWAAHVDRLPAFWLCRLSDLQPVAKFTGAVTVDQLRAAEPAVAVVEFAPRSLDTYAAALAWHCVQGSSSEDRGSSEELEPQFSILVPHSSILNLDADVPDAMLDLGRRVLIDQRIDFPDAGVSMDWTGESRSITIAAGRIDVRPGVAMRVRKFGLSKSCSLDAVTYTEDLSSVTFELTGMLDLTVNLK